MRVFVFVVGLLLSACQSVIAPVENQPGGEIVDLRSGQVMSAHELLERLAGAPRVIVGEQHDNPEHHQVQLWLLQALAERRSQGSLLLEMLNEYKDEGLTHAAVFGTDMIHPGRLSLTDVNGVAQDFVGKDGQVSAYGNQLIVNVVNNVGASASITAYYLDRGWHSRRS